MHAPNRLDFSRGYVNGAHILVGGYRRRISVFCVSRHRIRFVRILKGFGYLVLLFVCSVIFHLIEKFLSTGTAAKLARRDAENRDLRRD
jgi:hypothetical protein